MTSIENWTEIITNTSTQLQSITLLNTTENDSYVLSIIYCSHQRYVTPEINITDPNKNKRLQGNTEENGFNDSK